jgi:SAM-dependent methyltransferase
MENNYESKYHDLEKEHWWFLSRRNLICQLVRKYANSSNVVLDVGCSSGLLLQDLRSNGFTNENLYGIDVSEVAIQRATEVSPGSYSVMDGSSLRYQDSFFDLIISSDSLEHIKNDKQAVHDWVRCLKPNGILIIFVPAYNFLWSNHDVVNHHFRRYTSQSLLDLFMNQSFSDVVDIKQKGYWNTLLSPVIVLVRLLQKILKSPGKSEGDLGESHPLSNKFLKAILRIEENLIQRDVRFPFGISTFLVIQKNS